MCVCVCEEFHIYVWMYEDMNEHFSGVGACAWVHACVCVYVCAFMHACVCVCVCTDRMFLDNAQITSYFLFRM